MTWVLDEEGRHHRHLLLSLGNDGKLLMWEVVSGQRELRPVKAMRLLTESVPRSIRISKAKGDVGIGGKKRPFFFLSLVMLYYPASQVQK